MGSGLTTAFLPKVFISPFAVYSNALQESANSILYNGLIEELVDVLQITDKQLMVSINILLCASGLCVFSFWFFPGVENEPQEGSLALLLLLLWIFTYRVNKCWIFSVLNRPPSPLNSQQ